jgi:hypothetical protein
MRAVDQSTVVERKPGEEQAESEEEDGPPHDLKMKRPPVAAGPRQAPGEGVGDGHADGEEKEGKDEVGRRPAVPFGVEERPVRLVPVAGVVDQDHGGDGQAAEDVERAQALRARLGLSVHVRLFGTDGDHVAGHLSLIGEGYRIASNPRVGAGLVGGRRLDPPWGGGRLLAGRVEPPTFLPDPPLP